jgi:hypothetical protein
MTELAVMKRVLVLALMAIASPARAEQALFEIVLDIDRDGTMDRAALVAADGAGFYAPNKAWFMIGTDQHVDLYVYLGGGDAPLDPARPPTFVKRDIAIGEQQNQIFPLEAREGSLIVKTAYNLHSNWVSETLTIVHRGGGFLVGGWMRDIDTKDGARGRCDINFLTRSGTVSGGVYGRRKAIDRPPGPVSLRAWTASKYLKLCAR